MANLFTETFDTDIADGWGGNWTAVDNSGALNQLVSGGKGILSTASTSYTHYQNTRATGMADTTDTEMVVDVASTGTSDKRLLYFVINDNLPTNTKLSGTTAGTGIWVQMGDTSNSTVPTLYARSGGTDLTAALPSISLDGDGATLRLRRVGNTVSAKMWPTGTTEPAGWGATLNISSKSIPAGPIGFRRDATGGSGSSNSEATFDNILVTDGINVVNAEFNAATAAISATSHEATWFSPDAFYDTSTVTASLQAHEATVGINVSTTLDTPSVSTAAPDVTIQSREIVTVDVFPVDDYAVDASGNIYEATSGTLELSTSNSRRGIFLFELPANFQQEGFVKAEFGIAKVSGTGQWVYQEASLVSNLTTNPYNSTVLESKAVNVDWAPTYEDFSETFDEESFAGFMVQSVPSSEYGSGGAEIVTSENSNESLRPRLRLTYELLPMVVNVDVPTAGVNVVANEAVAETIDPVSEVVDVSSASMSTRVSDATFEEIRTVALSPVVDGHRVQGADTFINSGNTLTISYNPSASLTAVLSPQGTDPQKAAVNKALESFDFPLEVLSPYIQAKYGKSSVEVIFEDLPDGDSGGMVLGEFRPNGVIALDSALEASELFLATTLYHEIGHLLDDCYITMEQRVRLWNAMHSNPNEYVGPGTQIVNGAYIHHGHAWSGIGPYYDRVEEAFAQAFARAYTTLPLDTNLFASHPATLGAAKAVREILTPSIAENRGPWPTKLPAARFYFDELPPELVVGEVLSADLSLNVAGIVGNTSYEVHTFNTGWSGFQSVQKPVTLASGQNSLDISEILNTKNFSGVHLGKVNTGGISTVNISSSESTDPDPVLVVRFVVSQDATLVDADTANADLFSADVTVETVISPNVLIDVETATVNITGHDATPVLPIEVNLSSPDPVVLDGEEAEVIIRGNSINDMDTPRVFVDIVRVTDVNGEPVLPTEEDDRFFSATMQTLVGRSWIHDDEDILYPEYNQVWFRMNERSGAVASDRLFLVDDTTPEYTHNVYQEKLDLSNVTVGLNDGPEGRHHFYFNGDAYAAQRGGQDTSIDVNSGIEFTFRTTKKNQFIMGNADEGAGWFSAGPVIRWELWMVDGFLEIRTRKAVGNPYAGDIGFGYWDDRTYRGFTDVADGQWHHIVLQTSYEGDRSRSLSGSYFSGGNPYWGLELYIDSKLDLRRKNHAVAVAGFPDYIGGRPNNYYPNGGGPVWVDDLPRAKWFVGDMTELVYRYGRNLSYDEIARQRDAMFGIYPVLPETAASTFRADEAVAKGNKPRVLVLDFSITEDITKRATAFTPEPQAHAIQNLSPKTIWPVMPSDQPRVWQAFVGLGDAVTHYPEFEQGDLLFFKHKVGQLINGYAPESWRTDPVTDNWRVIDLDIDLNMDDFDLISIVGFPADSKQWDEHFGLADRLNVEPKVPMNIQVENVLRQIREQVTKHGKSLFISDPFSAIALGIVDQVDVVPDAYEHHKEYGDGRIGAINPGYDAHSFAIDVFGGHTPMTKLGANGVPRISWEDYSLRWPGPKSREKAADRYVDTHALTAYQRIRAEIPGLTDIGSYVRVDEITWYNVNPFNEPPYVYSRKYEDKRAGLKVGDVFYTDHHPGDETVRSWELHTDRLVWKDNGFRVAAPMSAVKVGTVVTTYNNFFYAGVEEARTMYTDNHVREIKGNPYGDHAISIAIQPGDVWDGERVSGKVYVNFTEALQPRAAVTKYEPILKWKHLFPDEPGTLAIGDELYIGSGVNKVMVSPEMTSWWYTTALDSISGSEIRLPESKPDWGWSPGGTRGSGLGGGSAHAMNWSSKPPTDLVPINVMPMVHRAVKWLTSDLDLSGSATVNVGTAKIDTTAHETTTEVSTATIVELSTARVNAEAHTDADTIASDVTVLQSTPGAVLMASGVNTDIDVSSAGISLDVNLLQGSLGEAVDWSDAIILTLPRQIITLTLEEN